MDRTTQETDSGFQTISRTEKQIRIDGPHEQLPTAQAGWQRSLSAAIRSSDELIDRLQLSDDLRIPARAATERFPLVVPLDYLNRMRTGDSDDPLLKQVLPLRDELEVVPGFSGDPVGDGDASTAPGLIQKYSGRALLIATGVCAVHCRYCFRREFPYYTSPRRMADWQPAFEAIDADDTLHEVILSGGDPLMLTDARLREIIMELEKISHVRRLRIHTRLPIVLPNRITEDLLALITGTRLTPIVVVHANHANEIAGECEMSLRRLVQSGITTLNQAVLLRRVNDSINAQFELCERLIDVGVLPYYLHQLDRVQGAAHFEVNAAKGRDIVSQLRERLPGYAVPKFVREVPGALSKRSVERNSDGRTT